jgi:hypothetical protein
VTKHYEVIYETGTMAVVNAEDEEDAKAGLAEQHRRALNGEPGQLPSSSTAHPSTGELQVQTHAAERIKRVFVYDDHPADLTENLAASKEVFTKHVTALIKEHTDENGIVDVVQVASKLQAPVINPDASRHESRFMAEGTELELDFLPKG